NVAFMDKCLWMALEQDDFRKSETFKEALRIRTAIAVESGDLQFFVRLGRALEKSPELKIVPRDKVADTLCAGWLTSLHTGSPRLCDMTDQAITDWLNLIFQRSEKSQLTLDFVRKLRQRLNLRRDSKPKFTAVRQVAGKFKFT